jgi:hypothetical protein
MAPNLTDNPRDREIVDLARRQRGLITSKQLIALGVGRRTLKRWVASGRLWHVHRSVYVLGPQPLTKHGRWLAAVMAKAPAVLSHESAAALWGLAGDRRDIDVTATHGRRGLNDSGIRLHVAQLRRDEWLVREGIPVTTVARTLFDLAEAVEPPRLESAWDEASRLRLLRVKQVATVCERWPTRPACRLINPLLSARLLHDTERRRSPLEDRFAAFEKDRDRDTEHLLAGYRTIRVTHRRLDEEPDRLATQLRTLLGQQQSSRSET